MKTTQRKGWLSIALLAIAVAMPGRAGAQDGWGTIGADNVQVAQVITDSSLLVTGTTSDEESGNGSIQMDLVEPEQDVLTRAAIDKLDVEIGSLTFRDTELADVIRFIGRKLDLNFIFDSDVVQGRVTLTFRNVRVRDALDSILSAQKLALVPDRSGIFRIVPQDRVGGQEVETRTEVIQLNWVAADDILETMNPFLSDHGKMQINQESNVIIITDVPPNLQNIKDLITRVDLPERQVMIEARLVDVNIGALRELGTDWTLSKTNEIGDYAPESELEPSDVLGVVNLLNEGFSYYDDQSTMALGEKLGIFGEDYNLNMVFRFLEDHDVVEVLANPRVTTLNNVPANIEIIEKIPYESGTNLVQGAGSTAQIEFKDAGVRIKVRPIITPNGFVRMEVNLAQMIYRSRVGSKALAPPRIDERNAGTNVIVQSGNTVVLGGLRQVRSVNGVRGVPYLHRIPVLGWLFKKKTSDQSRTELVLMMTPRVIEEAVGLSEHERDLYDRIEKQWHRPDRMLEDVMDIDE